ncbi:Tubulin polyglutamylase [Phytophthora megakarya]|uniref:Tubulin polyglutamylase n=1 Tax=Phytophthora megakarya TaxID=4795 RepID=A0A225X0J0_9STRA|nr:Tubulin polyglutamylase [Phytophthora megakarya]
MECKRTSKRKSKRVRINVTLCRYEVVRRAARARGWTLVTDEKPEGKPSVCNLHWIDVPDILPTFKTLLPYQKVNHFPGMASLACKSKLARNLNRMKKLFPSEYDFVPRTWILPFDQFEFQQNFNSEGESQRTFIVKPDHMCQGRGVFLTRKLSQIPRGDVLVAQQYVARPLLIDGKKFDLRIYVLVTSCSPLRVYIFKDGLVRMCTADYVTPNVDNLDQRFMHLTNYAVNKHSNNFEANKGDDTDGKGSKRSLKWFFPWLKEIFPSEKVDALWDKIGDICLKSILSVQPTLAQEYKSTFAKYLRRSDSAPRSGPQPVDMNMSTGNVNNGGKIVRPASAESINNGNSSRPASARSATSTDEDLREPASSSSLSSSCSFALLGMDVLIDEQLKPWLLEVNHLPSFGCDSALDWSVKEPLISQTFDLLNISAIDKRRYEAEHNHALQQRLYGGASSSSLPSSPMASDNQRSELPVLIPPSPRINTPEDTSEVDKRVQLPLNADQLRETLTSYYNHFNVDRLLHLDKIVSKYGDNQGELNRSLQQKYGKDIIEFAPRDAIASDTQQQVEDLEQTVLIDFVRVYPPSSSERDSKYRKMLDASQQQINELQLRFSAPLQHRRPETDINGVAFPPLKGAQKKEQLGRDCFGFSGTDKAQWLATIVDKKPPVVPGPMQVAAAHRMMLGHSSQKLSIKPPTPPEPLASRSGTPVNYGLQYRERLATHKNKPTLAVSQVSFCFNGTF